MPTEPGAAWVSIPPAMEPRDYPGPRDLVAGKFVCPFFRRSPHNYQQEICSGPGWTSVTRLKEHLYRKHLLPQNICPRCQEPFSSPDQLVEHARSEEPCETRMRELQEGINEAQYKALKRRSKPSSKGGPSEEQRWNEVYAILFPEHRPIPSPYPKSKCENCDSERFTEAELQDLLSDLSEYARNGLPEFLRPKVYRVLGGDDCDPARLDEIVSVAQEALEQLILCFQRPGIASEVAQVPRPPVLDEDTQPPLSSPALNDAHVAETPSLVDGLQTGSSLFLDSGNLNYSDAAMPQDGQRSWWAAISLHSQDMLGDYINRQRSHSMRINPPN